MIAAVDALSIYNPTSAPAYDLDAFLGDWQMLNAPEFKGDLGLDADGRRQARAEARAAIPWFEAWEEPATPRCDDEEEALVNAAAVMGFNYAYEGFPTC